MVDAFEQEIVSRRNSRNNEEEVLNALLDPRCSEGEERLPSGWRRVPVYTNGDQIVVCGWPDSEDETHNCDAMGCGFGHVLYRFMASRSESPANECESTDAL